MHLTYEHKPVMTLIRMEEGYTRCPEFWDVEYNWNYARLWQIGRFAICEQKADCFEYWIAGLYRGGAVPEGLKLYRFPESDWAVFSAKGPLPGSLQTLNTYIWQTWYPAEGQQVVGNGAAALEVYSAGDMQSPDYACGIWVPIVRPQQTADDSAETAAAAALLGLL